MAVVNNVGPLLRRNDHREALFGAIGTLAPGTEADVVALDSRATPAMALRAETIETLAEELFLLETLGDDRAIAATYVAGVRWRPAA